MTRSINEIPTHINKHLGTVIGEREVVVKERKAGAYRLSAYYIAKMVSELPMLIILPIVQLSAMYWMAGIGGPIAFAMYIGINLLNCFTNQIKSFTYIQLYAVGMLKLQTYLDLIERV
uniref:ABC transporter G family member 9 n=1 Tax=Magallana gigas TaxID=29159 RepID=K1PRH1_MAGGI